MSNNDNNVSDVKKPRKKKEGALKKKDKYIEQRKNVMDRLNKILGITDSVRSFDLLDINETKQTEIENLEDDMRKYFNCSRSRLYKTGLNVERKFLSMIKLIYKAHGLKLNLLRQITIKNGVRSTKIIYTIGPIETTI